MPPTRTNCKVLFFWREENIQGADMEVRIERHCIMMFFFMAEQTIDAFNHCLIYKTKSNNFLTKTFFCLHQLLDVCDLDVYSPQVQLRSRIVTGQWHSLCITDRLSSAPNSKCLSHEKPFQVQGVGPV